MPNVAPRLFIGSSTEAQPVAAAIQTNLDQCAEVTIWNQNIFAPSIGTLESLEDNLTSFDFAAFVLAPDDIVKFRGDQTSVARDNVIFETGLFMGKLGRRKVFLVRARGTDLRLPTDLAGIAVLQYNPNRSDRNLVAALGPACNTIQETMRNWSPMSARTLAINPHYDSDLELLDVNFDLRSIVTPKTIFVISGDVIVSELLDRPTAAFLRDKIDSKKGGRAIIVSDSKWISDSNIRPNPAISIGSEKANKATEFMRAMVGNKSWNDANGHFGSFVGRDNCPLVALWGYSALTTRQAVESYIDKPEGLAGFFKICGIGD
jgi:predicted nucleotide-binding protein with TIR-like domain